MAERTESLRKLLATVKEAELIRLRELSAERSRATEAVSQLERTRLRRMQEVSTLSEPDAAMSSGSDLKWQQWAERERFRLGDADAEIATRQGAQRDRAAKAFGRLQAFDCVLRKLVGRGN